jgi:hypothetical protein
MSLYHMGDGQLVTLIVATEDGPIQVDVAMSTRPLDADDPRKPGDIIFRGPVEVDLLRTGLEAVVWALKGAS